MLVRPISTDDQHAFKMAVQDPTNGIAQPVAALAARLETLHTNEIGPHFKFLEESGDGRDIHKLRTLKSGRQARAVVEEIATELTKIIADCHKLALSTCTTKQTNPRGNHFSIRGVKKQRRRLSNRLKANRALSELTHSNPTISNYQDLQAAATVACARMPTGIPQALECIQEQLIENSLEHTRTNILALIEENITMILQDIRTIDLETEKTQEQQLCLHNNHY